MAGVDVRESPIEGLGVFAARAYRKGERMRRMHVVREVTTETPLQEDLGERAEHCAYPDGRVLLIGYPDRHFNHSCDPNGYKAFVGNAMYVVARRPIASGDEITLDYAINTTGGASWPCHCGTQRCRGTVVGDFFALPDDLQREYLPLLAPWFVQRHQERIQPLRRLTSVENE